MENGSRLKLQKLTEEQSNKAYTFLEINQIYDNRFTTNEKGVYFPYNHITKDSGWGCAWRAIQTLLSTHNIEISFEDLYYSFSERDALLEILIKAGRYKSSVLEQLSSKTWTPADISCHWAEPFIASIICSHYCISHQLLLLNGPAKSYAPLSVFQKVITFRQLLEAIKIIIRMGSIMIDDGQYALSIIGLNSQSKDSVQILFGDPHIKSNKRVKQAGVYRKTFDLNGKGTINQQTKFQQQESLYSVYSKLEFQTKCWMICVPNE